MESQGPLVNALAGTLFTWAVTALGSAAVYLTHQPTRTFLDGALGFAAGMCNEGLLGGPCVAVECRSEFNACVHECDFALAV